MRNGLQSAAPSVLALSPPHDKGGAMKENLTYLIQTAGLAAAAIGLVLILDNRPALALIVLGGLAWYVGGYAREKHLL